MNFLSISNNAFSTLASGITSGATSLTVATGEGARFPVSNFLITVFVAGAPETNRETMLCTSRSGDVLTVVRGQEGTIALSHSVGAGVELRVMAKHILDLNAMASAVEQRTSDLPAITANLGRMWLRTDLANIVRVVSSTGAGAWSAGGALAVARSSLAGAGSQTAGLSFGGHDGATIRNTTEHYNGTVWSAGGALAVARHSLAGTGSQTAGLSFGGLNGGIRNTTEHYNGTSWSAGGALAVARHSLAGAGSQTAGLSFGGWTGVNSATTEHYNLVPTIRTFTTT